LIERKGIGAGDLLFRTPIIGNAETGIVLEVRPTRKPRYGTNEKRMEYKVWAKDTRKNEWVDEMKIGIDWITLDEFLTFGS
jgi:hypothetical protein